MTRNWMDKRKVHCAYSGDDVTETLCGRERQSTAWAQPSYFIKQASFRFEDNNVWVESTRCSKCLAHEDLALLFLGDLP